MGHAALAPTHARASESTPGFRVFVSLLDNHPSRSGRGLALLASFAAHTLLASAAILIPVLLYDALPEPGDTVRAFFVAPDLAPPPPPPPPPPAAGVRVPRAPAVARPAAPSGFVAPIEIPTSIAAPEGLDLGGVEGGVPGGVEGGVPGGVVGGVVGGLPLAPPPAPRRAVRVGGAIVAPKLVHRVAPEYPALAAMTRIHGVVVLEATVDEAGRVQDVSILRGQPILQEAAVAAVRQWRYQPLLLNGEATPFILTVTLNFNLTQ
jgi:periplasmic protein TonB